MNNKSILFHSLITMNLTHLLLVTLFISLASSAYDNKLAKKLAYFSGAAYSTQAEINSWTCKYCSYSPLQTTKVFSNVILDVFGYTGYSAQLNAIIVTFRSTASIQNWIVNVDANQVKYPHCDGCLVHQGFYNAFQGVEGYVRQNVQALMAKYRGAKIMVTGFSLGSALAVFGALDIKQIFNQVDEFYSFGQPRIGNQLFATYFAQSISTHFRVIHYADIVPHLPPQVPLPYSHYAYEIWYDQAMQKYKLCGAEEYSCSKSILPFKWSTSDHDIVAYVKILLTMEQNETQVIEQKELRLNE